MRRRAIVLAAVGLILAGCGGIAGKNASPAPSTVVGTVPTTPEAKGDPAAGKMVFTGTAGCAGCHTLKDAAATGTVGPNLDDAKPPLSLVIERVTNGKAPMPAFAGTLTPQQIADVAAYVVQATSG